MNNTSSVIGDSFDVSCTTRFAFFGSCPSRIFVKFVSVSLNFLLALLQKINNKIEEKTLALFGMIEVVVFSLVKLTFHSCALRDT